MQDAAKCRRKAQECLDLAEQAETTDCKALLDMASEWLRLASLAEVEEAVALRHRLPTRALH